MTAWNLTPLLHVLLIGAAVGCGPLAWVWVRAGRDAEFAGRRRLQRLLVLTAFLTFDLIVFGAFTRLTDSGLGCPDWPGCYGHASPVGAQSAIQQEELSLPSGPVTERKAWIEMVHRYLATAVGMLIVTVALLQGRAWRRGEHTRFPWLAVATVVWVVAQGLFGALTVTMRLFPAIVSMHLVGGIGLLMLLLAQHLAEGAPSWAQWSPRAGVGVAFAVVAVQVLLGAWVSTNYAVLACNEFPLCQGQWWPAMRWSQAFELWHPLGRSSDGQFLSLEALTAIHIAHRWFALVVLGVVGAVLWRVRARSQPQARRAARWLLALLAVQVATGLSNVVLEWPLLAALLHTAGATALVASLSVVLLSSRPCRPPAL